MPKISFLLSTSIFYLLNFVFISSVKAGTLDLAEWTTLGDVIVDSNDTFITNAFSNGLDDLTNLNISGENPIEAFEVEFELDLPDGALGFSSGDTSSIFNSSFMAKAGQKLTFDWNFATNHLTPELSRNDYGFISINDDVITLADTNTLASMPGFAGFAGQTGSSVFSYTFSSTDDYVLGIGVVDVGDSITSSGLLVRNVTLEDENIVSVSEPSTFLGLAFGCLIFLKKRLNKKQDTLFSH